MIIMKCIFVLFSDTFAEYLISWILRYPSINVRYEVLLELLDLSLHLINMEVNIMSANFG